MVRHDYLGAGARRLYCFLFGHDWNGYMRRYVVCQRCHQWRERD